MRRSRAARIDVRHGVTVSAVGGTPAYAAIEAAGAGADADHGATRRGRRRHRRGGRGRRAPAARLRAGRADRQDLATEPHAGLAYERFTPDGPVALLPEGDHYGLVWTTTPAPCGALAGTRRSVVSRASLRCISATRTHGFTRVADRRTFPLALEFAPTAVGTRCVVLGNAAQALHPVAGQGFNLGLRDAAELAQSYWTRRGSDRRSRRCSRATPRSRRTDRWAGIAFTHGSSAFSATTCRCCAGRAGWRSLCSTRCRAAKRAFTRAMMFGLR